MSLKNKHGDMTPFDMSRRPVRQNAFLMPLVWAACFVLTRTKGLVHIKRSIKGIKPPFIVIAMHQGESDYYIAPRALFPHRANYVSDMEGFAMFGNELYRQLGCIGKRRFVSDISVIRNIEYALFTLHQPVVIYPESRHCDAGVTSTLPDNIGRLLKHFGVPAVLLSSHGSYLANPFWDESRTRHTRLSASVEVLFTTEDIEKLSAEEIQRITAEKLVYDEYSYQLENRISITEPYCAEGLHMPLYKCSVCGEEAMQSEENTLYCTKCHGAWVMDGYGVLHGNGGDVRIPDWYRWERCEAELEVRDHGFDVSFRINVEALPNEKGFVSLGTGVLHCSEEGYELGLDTPPECADSFPISFPVRSMMSLQNEYNYRDMKKGTCIVLSTKNCCYYCYSDDPAFIVTKLEFIQEYLCKRTKKSSKI
ncbi:MAG: hypothetical protein ILP19_00375 [Oscillospiraceae bacterium]|nr:hypothetical protein [Oscillospiraceae bacterium]